MASVFSDRIKNRHKKRTRQGLGRGTKFGTKPQGNASRKQLQRYKKKSRGQGKQWHEIYLEIKENFVKKKITVIKHQNGILRKRN